MRASPLVILSALAFANTPIDRLQTSHLAAVHAQRLEWLKKRASLPTLGVYNDYRAALNVYSEDADADHDQAHKNAGKNKDRRTEIVAAAKEAGVNVVMLTDPPGAGANSPSDPWSGLRDGILFITGSQDDHVLRFPSPIRDLNFLSHVEEHPDISRSNDQGMAIYDRHSDAAIHSDVYDYISAAMKKPLEWRRLAADLKAYPDEAYAAGTGVQPRSLDRWDQELFRSPPFTAVAANDAHQNQVFKRVTFDPYAVAFRFVSTHILARDLTEPDIRESLAAGRAYVAFDWLCDPSGFVFTADNGLGVYDMGDDVGLDRKTTLTARLPIPAKIKLIHGSSIVAEAHDSKLTFTVKEIGAYRLEAWLTVDGEDRPWIFSNPILIVPHIIIDPPRSIRRPPANKTARNISYTVGDPSDAGDHRLDLYLPKDKTNFPVLVFYSGWSWQSDDRAAYAGLGDRFARAGIGVAISSYRAIARTPFPAQIDDAAAAFAWVYKNIASYGGDPSRIYIAGHSAGGQVAALLALDPQYLKTLDIPQSAIHGVAALSGIYDVSHTGLFGDFGLDASPNQHIHSGAPPFLITYCQWDYLGFPKQARDFAAALRSKFVPAKLVYIPGKNHFSEILDVPNDEDATAAALLDFIK